MNVNLIDILLKLDIHKMDVWLGLRNPILNMNCSDQTCEGLLTWEDGSDFIYEESFMGDLNITSDGIVSICHFFSQSSLTIELADCSEQKLGGCQTDIQCPGR